MPRKSFAETIDAWAVKKRIEQAEKAIIAVTKELDQCLQRSENIRHLFLEANSITGQIPRSRAAYAFEQLRIDALAFNIIRIVSIWENPAENSFSIPTIVALVDDEEVIQRLEERVFEKFTESPARIANPDPDPEMQALIKNAVARMQAERAKKMSSQNSEMVRTGVTSAREIVDRETVRNLRNFRDQRSHLLQYLRGRKDAGKVSITIMDVEELLIDTVRIAQQLYNSVNGVSYDLADDVRRLCRQRADEFWLGLSFKPTN